MLMPENRPRLPTMLRVIPASQPAARDDVLGNVGQQAVVTEGESPQADERFGDADPELDRDHAGRVVHRDSESRR